MSFCLLLQMLEGGGHLGTHETFPKALDGFAHLPGRAAGLAVRMSTHPHGETPQTFSQPKKQALLLIPICCLGLFVMGKNTGKNSVDQWYFRAFP